MRTEARCKRPVERPNNQILAYRQLHVKHSQEIFPMPRFLFSFRPDLAASVPTDYLLRLAPLAVGSELECLVYSLACPRIRSLPTSVRRRAWSVRRRAVDLGLVPDLPLSSVRLAYRWNMLQLPPGILPFTPTHPHPTPWGSKAKPRGTQKD